MKLEELFENKGLDEKLLAEKLLHDQKPLPEYVFDESILEAAGVLTPERAKELWEEILEAREEWD